MTETIWVVGYPRSGNTWLARLLGDVLNSPIDSRMPNHIPPQPALADEGYDRKGKYVIKQQHLRELPPDGKIVFIYRDPRDVIVSVKHYWEKTIEEAVEHVCLGIPLPDKPRNGGWPEFMQLWLDSFKTSAIDCMTTYELLHGNTRFELARILEQLHIHRVHHSVMDEVIARQSFTARQTLLADNPEIDLPYGSTIQRKSLYKGEVGNWRDELVVGQRAIAHRHLWDWLERLRYEDNKDWWQQ